MTAPARPIGFWTKKVASAIAQTPVGTPEVSPYWIAERRRLLDPDAIRQSARRLAATLPAPAPWRTSR